MLNMYKEEQYDKAMDYAYKGKYEVAINYLLPLAHEGDSDSINNLGVCYMRINQYVEAYKWLKKCNYSLAIKNILTIYDCDNISFNLEEYVRYCNILIDRKDPAGYLYLSYIYQNNKRGVESKRLAYLIIVDGLKNAVGDKRKLYFEYSWLSEIGIGCKIDYFKSYTGYKTLACDETFDESFRTTSRYNLGLQLIQGKGCKVNYKVGIAFLTLAAIDTYKDAYKYLIKIFSNIVEIKDLEQAEMWKAILEGKELTDKQKRIYSAVFRRTMNFKRKYIDKKGNF